MTNADELRELAEAEEPRAGMQGQPGLGGVLRPGGEDTTEILLIRHGQMPATSDTRQDQPLTELGMRQAEVLGEYLAAKPLHAVYSSPMLRARQTAGAIARHHGLDVVALDDLREIEMYLPEGVDFDELRKTDEYRALTERFQQERRWEVWGDLREHGPSMRKRIGRVFDDVVPRHKGQRIVLLTHGPIINAAIGLICESPFDSIVSTQLTGITTILAADDRRRILSVNSRPHFGV